MQRAKRRLGEGKARCGGIGHCPVHPEQQKEASCSEVMHASNFTRLLLFAGNKILSARQPGGVARGLAGTQDENAWISLNEDRRGAVKRVAVSNKVK